MTWNDNLNNYPQSVEQQLIPELPPSDQIELWQDVPAEDFEQPDKWTHRTALKQRFNLSERAFFRWLETLRSLGVSRTLPARTGSRMKLFYQPDIDYALTKQAAQAAQTTKRGRKSKVLTAITANSIETSTKTTTPPLTPASYGAKFLGSYSSSEVNYFTNTITQLQNENQTLRMQQQILSNAIVRIESMLSQLAVQQAALAAQLQLLQQKSLHLSSQSITQQSAEIGNLNQPQSITNPNSAIKNNGEDQQSSQLHINEMIYTTLNRLSHQIQQLPAILKAESKSKK